MRLTSRFAESGEIFFDADDHRLSDSDLELIERSYTSERGTSQTKAFVLKGVMLHYTYNIFKAPTEFEVMFDHDVIINTFHLRSDSGVGDDGYEPYLLCKEEFISNQSVPAGKVSFRTPVVAELFRLFMTPSWYQEILGNYGTTFESISQSIGPIATGTSIMAHLPISPQMKIVIKDVVRYKNPNRDLTRNFCRTKAFELIHLQLEQLLAQREKKGGKQLSVIDIERIHEARRILQINFKNPPTIKRLSEMLATNENKLKTGFTSLFNSTIYQYVIQVRIEKAIEMMRNGRSSIEQISDAVGYASLGHFTRAFTKAKGVAPSAFRKSIG
jgi:AraC-like DNA-binding protein